MTRELEQPGPNRKLISRIGPLPIWFFALALAGVAWALFALLLRDVQLASRSVLPFPVLASVFAAAELAVVHLHFRRNAHSFSLSEIALAAGLFLGAGPVHLVAAHLLGSGLVLAIYRRQPPFRLAFNLAQIAVVDAVLLTVFSALGGVDGGMEERWLACVAGVLVASLVSALVVFVAISIAEQSLDIQALPQVLLWAAASALANGSLGLLAVALLQFRASALILLVVPVCVLFLAYRGYAGEREKHRNLELLYESTRLLNEGRELDEAVMSLLTMARSTFRAEVAALVLPPGEVGGAGRLSRVGPGEHQEAMTALSLDVGTGLWRLLTEDSETRVLSGSIVETLREARLIGETGRGVLVAPLVDDGRALGALVIAGRLGQVGRFDAHDARLLSLVAAQLASALEHGRLERSLAQLEALERELSHRAHHDPLTGLANRTLFRDRVSAALARVGVPSAVAFIDLDDFKTVNDSLGHHAGDRLLVEVAGRIAGAVRDGDITARLGGDEFALLLEDISGPDEALEIGERVLAALSDPVVLGETQVRVHASVGIALSDGVNEATELLRNADTAMYSAKAAGKGRVARFESGMHLQVLRRLELKGELRRALERDDQIHVQYQPVVELATGRIAGAEALVRWQHPVHGDIRPDRFIALAEEDGLVVDLGRRVLERACLDLARWQDISVDETPLTVSVNLSPRQLQNDALLRDITSVLARAGVSPEHLLLEITESVVMEDAERSLGQLHGLRDLGIRIAIDDFGTGYSSLAYLQRLPVQVIKIDRSFIDDIAGGGQRAALVLAVLRLAQSLDLVAIAEGVESLAQFHALRDLDCPLGQGFLFSEPISSKEFEALVRSGAVLASPRALAR